MVARKRGALGVFEVLHIKPKSSSKIEAPSVRPVNLVDLHERRGTYNLAGVGILVQCHVLESKSESERIILSARGGDKESFSLIHFILQGSIATFSILNEVPKQRIGSGCFRDPISEEINILIKPCENVRQNNNLQ